MVVGRNRNGNGMEEVYDVEGTRKLATGKKEFLEHQYDRIRLKREEEERSL